MDNPALTSLLLGRIVGLFLVIWAFFIMFRRKECLNMVDKLKDNQAWLYVIAIATLPFSLTLVVIHPVWVMGWPVILTILGWALVVSSLFFLFLPRKTILHLIECLNKPASYRIHGIVSLVIGIYLVIMTLGL